MLRQVLRRRARMAGTASRLVHRRLASALRPAATSAPVVGAAGDLRRSKPELVAEHALLRQQLIVLARSTERQRVGRSDRVLLVVLASRVRTWRRALLIVPPATLLRRRRAGSRLLWRWRSAPRSREPRASAVTIAPIRRMARENRLRGAERIRGELLEPGIVVGQRTAQRHMRGARPPRAAGQTWATFPRTHGREIRACDVLPLNDVLFRPVFAFFVVEPGSRRVVHLGVTRAPPTHGSPSSCARRRRRAPDPGS